MRLEAACAHQLNRLAANHILGTQKRAVLRESFKSGSISRKFITEPHCGQLAMVAVDEGGDEVNSRM